MDVSTAAWIAAGPPPADQTAERGRCARCDHKGPLIDTNAVVSKNYGDLDTWHTPTGHGLCAHCAWALGSRQLRQEPFLIHHDPPRIRQLDNDKLHAALAKPLDPTQAITLPLRRNRTHVLPGAHWGHINIGATALTWDLPDTHRLAALEVIRSAGVPAAAIAGPAPPFRSLRTMTPQSQHEVLLRWPELGPWRARPPWLRVALRATTPTTTTVRRPR